MDPAEGRALEAFLGNCHELTIKPDLFAIVTTVNYLFDVLKRSAA